VKGVLRRGKGGPPPFLSFLVRRGGGRNVYLVKPLARGKKESAIRGEIRLLSRPISIGRKGVGGKETAIASKPSECVFAKRKGGVGTFSPEQKKTSRAAIFRGGERGGAVSAEGFPRCQVQYRGVVSLICVPMGRFWATEVGKIVEGGHHPSEREGEPGGIDGEGEPSLRRSFPFVREKREKLSDS